MSRPPSHWVQVYSIKLFYHSSCIRQPSYPPAQTYHDFTSPSGAADIGKKVSTPKVFCVFPLVFPISVSDYAVIYGLWRDPEKLPALRKITNMGEPAFPSITERVLFQVRRLEEEYSTVAAHELMHTLAMK